jgi:hypothetical protein
LVSEAVLTQRLVGNNLLRHRHDNELVETRAVVLAQLLDCRC